VAAAGITEVVGQIAECVHFELHKDVLGHFVEEPVYDHAALDTALGVEYQDDLLDIVPIEFILDEHVAGTHIWIGIRECALS
jgi:hypothetical protein